MLAQHIVHAIIIRFKQTNQPPYTAEELSMQLPLPISIVQPLLTELTGCQLLSQICPADTQEVAYLPAHDVTLLNDKAIQEALTNHGESYQIG